MNIVRRTLSNVLYVNPNITKLMVFDMAGTTVNEGGIVYDTLYDVINGNDISIKKREIDQWHGVNKREVIKHFVTYRYKGTLSIKEKEYILNEKFDSLISKRYFNKDSYIDLIHPDLPETFENLRENGVKIALNTGYPYEIQEQIITKLNMKNIIDDYISSQAVNYGRPYPYMIYHLMEKFNIKNSKEVIKVGDTANDIREGKNANCYMSVGVLSGAATEDIFEKENADFIIQDATRIKLI